MSDATGSSLTRFLREARRRRVYKVAVGYGAVTVGVIAGADPIFPALNLPDVAFQTLVIVLIGGFPVALVLGWIFDVTPQGVVRTPDLDPGPTGPLPPLPASVPPQRRGWRWPGRTSPQVGRPGMPSRPPPGGTRPPDPAPGTTPDPDRVRRATLAHLRHELRTPINAILGYSEMLLEDVAEDGVQGVADDLRRIHDAGGELLRLVDKILSPDHQADGELGEGALETFGRQLRHELRTPADTVIGYAELLLEDAQEPGRGTWRPDLERILSAGRRLTRSIDEIVEFHASMEDPGSSGEELSRSSEIARQALSRIQALEPDRPAATDLHVGHLLVVDDNAMNRDLLSRQLARAGYTVTTAASGEEALELAAKQDFDLMLLDIMMPGTSGFDVLRHLKGSEELRDVPVIMISALDEVDSVVRCIEMGAEDYLPKPFDPVLLRARIDASLAIRRLRDRQRQTLDELRREGELLDHMLSSVFPGPIAERFRGGESDIVDAFPSVAVLYAELEGSARLTTRSDPGEFVARMNDLFGVFEDLAREHGVQTTKLLGHAYLAVGGVPSGAPGWEAAVARLALDVLEAVAERGTLYRNPLTIRVGLHAGPAVAGILGTERRVSFEVWGEAVDTAKRMARNGEVGSVHVSPAAHAALQDRFSFENRGVIALDGKDHMRTYFLTGRKGGDPG